MWAPVDINDKGAVSIERQLVEFASPAPLVINKKDKETRPFECPGTTNDTDGEGLNNRGEIVGHRGHQPGSPSLALWPIRNLAASLLSPSLVR